MKLLCKWFVGLSFALLAGGINASLITLDSGNLSDTIDFSETFGTGITTDTQRVQGTITATGFGTTTIALTVNLTNASTGPSTDRLSSWGFGTTPNVASVSFGDASDGGLVGASLTSSPPGFPGSALIEVCAWSQNCAGGGAGGIAESASDQFTLTLTFASAVSSLAFDILGVKFEGGPTGAAPFFCSSADECGVNGVVGTAAIPEPATILLIGVAMLGMAALRRRRSGVRSGVRYWQA